MRDQCQMTYEDMEGNICRCGKEAGHEDGHCDEFLLATLNDRDALKLKCMELVTAFSEAFEAVDDMVGQHGGRETALGANEGAAWVLENFRELHNRINDATTVNLSAKSVNSSTRKETK